MTDIIHGKYQILDELGRGGMGIVYRARQTSLDRIVAVKMLPRDLAQNTEFVQRFRQEAVIIARLDHPNIIRVHDIEECDDTFYIIMEYVDGEALQRSMLRLNRLPEIQAIELTVQTALALHYAHSCGIVHRDIKPDNIMITKDDQVKVMDFGIARLAESDLRTQTGVSMGTPKYMSPEQAAGRKIDGRSDLYSLGIVLYAMITGRLPFESDSPIGIAIMHIQDQPPKPSSFYPEINEVIEQIILRCIRKDPAERHSTGMELADTLNNYRDQDMKPEAKDKTRTSPIFVAKKDDGEARAAQVVPGLTADGHDVALDEHVGLPRCAQDERDAGQYQRRQPDHAITERPHVGG